MLFPLYDNLNKDLPTKQLTQKQKTELIKEINNSNSRAKELIYTLIQTHNIKNNPESLTLPYQATQKDKDFSWDLNDLPISLQHILYKFMIIHKKSEQ